MIWNIHFKRASVPAYLAVSTFEIAIKRACDLLDQGADVREVASSGGCKGIDPEEIRLIWAERKLQQQPAGSHHTATTPANDMIVHTVKAAG